MPPSAVVDASVLVSAFLFPRSLPGELIDLAEGDAYRLCLSPILIEETRRSLINPRLVRSYSHTKRAVEDWCKRLTALAHMVDRLPDIGRVCRDADDDHVVGTAVAADSGFIVNSS